MHLSIEDLARVSLPDRGARGMMAMLEVYLDDSGTHDGAPLVVWGGICGHKHYLDQLDTAWRARLLKPCDGKPPIKAFHSYDLDHGIGEFSGYNDGARDLTRRNFRQVIVECSATVLAYGVSIRDRDQVVRTLGQMPGFTAEQHVFGQAIFEVAKAAKEENEPLTLQFDQGRDSYDLRSQIQPAIETAQFDGRFLSYGFSSVSAVPALQAADLVAHEAYRVLCQFRADPKTPLRAHTQKLFNDAFFGTLNWMGRREIKKAVQKIERAHRREREGRGA